MRYIAVFIIFFVFTSNVFAKENYKRVALVIGNAKYKYSAQLKNPANDARRLAEKFRFHKFDRVIHLSNLSRKEMVKSLREFHNLSQDADVAVIYFSGHGMEMGGTNYLVPVDARLATEYDVEDEAISLDRLLKSISGAGNLQLVILDACRNNPFKQKFISKTKGISRNTVSKGFAPVELSGNVIVSYAAKGGTVAFDGDGENSPFAQALLDNLFLPDLDIRLALGGVRDQVKSMMAGRQVPWHYGSIGRQRVSLLGPVKDIVSGKEDVLSELKKKALLLGQQIALLNSQMEIYERGERLSTGSTAVGDKVIQVDKAEIEQAEREKKSIEQQIASLETEVSWARAMASNSLDAYKDFVLKYPDSSHKAVANERIEFLTSLETKWKELARLNNSALKKIWQKLENSKNLSVLDKLFKLSSEADFKDTAYLKLKRLAKKEEKDWKNANTAGLRHSFKAFLNSWPNGFYANTASDRIAEIDKIEELWKKILAEPNEKSLETFIKEHGDTEFGPEATVLLAGLKRGVPNSADNSNTVTLSASELAKLVNGAKVNLRYSNAYFYFDSRLVPVYRSRLGKSFLEETLGQKLAAEGGFKAEYLVGRKRVSIEGIAGVVTSKDDNSATLYLLQMHGNEKTAGDVNKGDRKYATFQIVSSPKGYVCNGTLWQSVLSNKNPSSVIDHCSIERKTR